jgi:23S rRNA (adenine2030-N6)-methyltransferase
MNYRHAFHAGNHADVLKHAVLLAWIEALVRKEAPCFVLDTHAGRGQYDLGAEGAGPTGEAAAGIARLWGEAGLPPLLERLCRAVAAFNPDGVLRHYPGSPRLALAALRAQDRLAACERQPEEVQALRATLAGERRAVVHEGDGYALLRALLPPAEKRGLVLVDPPYEAQEAEYPRVLAAVEEALERWPTGGAAVWYPIKRRRSLSSFFREAARLAPRGLLCVELLVRPDDSPLRLNGSGMLLFHPPFQLDARIAPSLPVLARRLGEAGASHRLAWLRPAP